MNNIEQYLKKIIDTLNGLSFGLFITFITLVVLVVITIFK